jgi:hypothetical protein
MPSSRINIKIDSHNDKARRKLNHRANKLGNRAKLARFRRKSMLNKPGHREQGSYKPPPSDTPRQTRSYLTLSVELKKIEDAIFKEIEDYYNEHQVEDEDTSYEYEEYKSDPRTSEEYFKMIQQQDSYTPRDPKYIGEPYYSDVSQLTWGGSEDDY